MNAGNNRPPSHQGFPRTGPPPHMHARQFHPAGMHYQARSMRPASVHGHLSPHQKPNQQQMLYNKMHFPPPQSMRFGPEGGPPHPSNAVMRRPHFPPMQHGQMHPHPQAIHSHMRQMVPNNAAMHGPPPTIAGPYPGPSARPHMMNHHQQMQMRSLTTPMQHQQMAARPNGPNVTMPMGLVTASSPLRESRAHNVEITKESVMQKPQVPELAANPSPPKPVPSHQTEATLDAASILLGLRTTGSPSPSVEIEKRDDSPKREVDIRPDFLPTRLALADDENKLNSMHCFLRSELLELFVVESKPSKNDEQEKVKDYVVGSSCGRVGLRCIHCSQARKLHGSDGEAPMAVFYPKSISELYRLVTSWQRVHLRKCRNLPPSVHETYSKLKNNDKSRGKTQYWVTSARELGLVDCNSKAGGIRFASE
jgi:hypothetical protein